MRLGSRSLYDIIPVHDDALWALKQSLVDLFEKFSVFLAFDKGFTEGFMMSGLDDFVKELVQVLESSDEVVHVDVEEENDFAGGV